jgi:hypothetical protein
MITMSNISLMNFAKYLPIQGEIKDGSTYRMRGSGDIRKCEGDAVIERCHRKDIKYQLVELFVCNKDIKPGDKLRCYKPDFSEYLEVEFIEEKSGYVEGKLISVYACKYPNDSVGVALAEHFFKVIGTVSPEAIWVTEGMEFNDDEIQIIYKKRYECICEKPDVYRTKEQSECKHMIDDYRGGDFCDRKIDVIDIVKIKGPCGHFH